MKVGDIVTLLNGDRFEIKIVGIPIITGYYLCLNDKRLKNGLDINGEISYHVGIFNVNKILIENKKEIIDTNQLNIFDLGA